jgi:hypothetical protein
VIDALLYVADKARTVSFAAEILEQLPFHTNDIPSQIVLVAGYLTCTNKLCACPAIFMAMLR